MTELGNLTGYATSVLTGIIDRMIKKNLVQRVRDEEDRRVVKVVITEKGVDVAVAFNRFSLRSTVAALEKVDEEERQGFVLLFEKIANGFAQQS